MTPSSPKDLKKERPMQEEDLVDFIRRRSKTSVHDAVEGAAAAVAANDDKKEAAAAARVLTGNEATSFKDSKELGTATEIMELQAAKEDVENANNGGTKSQQPRVRRSSRIEERRAAEAEAAIVAAAAAAAEAEAKAVAAAAAAATSAAAAAATTTTAAAAAAPKPKKRNVGKSRAIRRSPLLLRMKRPKASQGLEYRHAEIRKMNAMYSPTQQDPRDSVAAPHRFLFADDEEDDLLLNPPRPPPLRPNHLGEHFVRVPASAPVGPNFAFLTPMSDLTPSAASSAGAVGGSPQRQFASWQPSSNHRRSSGISDVTMTVAIMPRGGNAKTNAAVPGVAREPAQLQDPGRAPPDSKVGAAPQKQQRAGPNARSRVNARAPSAPDQQHHAAKPPPPPPPRPASSGVQPMAAPARAAAALAPAPAPGKKGQPPRRRPGNHRAVFVHPLLAQALPAKKPPPPEARLPAAASDTRSPEHQQQEGPEQQRKSPPSANAPVAPTRPRHEADDEGEEDRTEDP